MALFKKKSAEAEEDTKMLKIISKSPKNVYNYQSIFQNLSPYVSSNFFVKDFHLSPVSTSECGKDSDTEIPKLPVPSLKRTLYKYMRTVRPLLKDEEYAKHCQEMLKSTAKDGDMYKMHQLLKERAKTKENWLEEWWLNYAYLANRTTVCVYSSPGLLMPFQEFKDKCEQICYTAKLILAAFNYMAQINNDCLKQERMGKKLLDMSQYKKVFGTCRIPGAKVDTLQYCPLSTHIVVCHNNHFFRLDMCVNKQMINLEQLVELLKSIVSNSQCVADPVGLLSAEHRDKWGALYEKISKDGCNKHAMSIIQSAAFVVCLDGKINCEKDKLTAASKNLIHGCGSKLNGGNRWYDKTLNFVVTEDGAVGMLYEHSPAEGQPVAVMADYIVNCIDNFNAECLEPAEGIKCPEKLTFNMDKDFIDGLNNAIKNLDQLSGNLQLNCIHFKDYGKEFIKSQKLSPDSFIQMAFQVAFYRTHKIPGVCYESAATRMFKHGRTETIRSCSLESVHFARTFLDKCASDEDKIKALCYAIEGHKKYTVEALQGFGVDRHLLGIRLMAKEKKIAEPAPYSNVGFKKSSHFRLSTSQVATKCYGLMSYGPGPDDGYSLCYNPRADDMFFSVGAFNSCKETDATVLGKALVQTLKEMCELLSRHQKSNM